MSASKIRSVVALVAAVVAVVGSGCAAVDYADEGAERADRFADIDGTDDAPRAAGEGPDGEDACRIEVRSVGTALDAYLAIHGSPPADVDTLIDDGLISGEIRFTELSDDGTQAVPRPDAPCA